MKRLITNAVVTCIVAVLLLSGCGGGSGGSALAGVWVISGYSSDLTIVIWESGGTIFGTCNGGIADKVVGTKSGKTVTLKFLHWNDSSVEYECTFTLNGGSELAGTLQLMPEGDSYDVTGTKQEGSGVSGVWSYSDCNGNKRMLTLFESSNFVSGRTDDGLDVIGWIYNGEATLYFEDADGNDLYNMEVSSTTGVGTIECADGSDRAVDLNREDKDEPKQNITNIKQGKFDGQATGSYSGSCSSKYGSGFTRGTYTLDVKPGGTFVMSFLDPNGEKWVDVNGTWQSANNTYAMMNGRGSDSLTGTMTVKGTITLDSGSLGASGTFSTTGGYGGTSCSGTFK